LCEQISYFRNEYITDNQQLLINNLIPWWFNNLVPKRNCEIKFLNNPMFDLKLLCFITLLLHACTSNREFDSNCITIDFWYGDHQSFGNPGLAQRWINILGNVSAEHGIKSLYYKLNDSDSNKITWGQDQHRLANPGDFNIDIHYNHLKGGTNIILVSVMDSAGHQTTKEMKFEFVKGNNWPLPYKINWAKVQNICEVAQIVDGHWKLTRDGIRTLDPWYDRIIAIGDGTWKNYEITTSVIFHGFTPPIKGPPNYGVSHAALSMRWPGHDNDHNQPHIKWYPLGATCEFQLKKDLDSCRWRILGDRSIKTEDSYQHFPIQLGVRYNLKSQVDNIEKDLTRYRVKIWPARNDEPENWQLTAVEGAQDIQSGSALLIAHNTDVTFGNVSIIPLE